MSADLPLTEPKDLTSNIPPDHPSEARKGPPAHDVDESEDESEDDEEEEEEEDDDDDDDADDEPKLKYAKLTGDLAHVYRNGDSTSAALVAGDKLVLGTHNGNIHVVALPGLRGVRMYHAHQATVTSVSVSPVPPPPTRVRTEEGGLSEVGLLAALGNQVARRAAGGQGAPTTTTASPRGGAAGGRAQKAPPPRPPAVPNTPSNNIYVATSSLDGHVCVSSLIDPDDVLLRNFARPVQAVALSPDYRNDRMYLSGGLAGNLILTVGGKAGRSSDANTNSAAAAASGWLGSLGLTANTGKDTILHSGEGGISTIKWSLTGKWVVWVNEEGIKIMRSHLKLGSEQSEDAWRRIAHAAKPNRRGWRDMAGVWKARAEWIDEKKLESELDPRSSEAHDRVNGTSAPNGNAPVGPATPTKKAKKIEKLVVGWGDTAWILHIHEGGTSLAGKTAGQKQVGSADIMHKLHFTDCVVSGISLYTPSLLAILAYRTRDDDDKPVNPTGTNKSSPRKGGQHRRTGLAPQLRLVNVRDGEEVDLDELSISRFETLSAQDYHLNTLYMPAPLPVQATKEQQRGALEAVWEASGGGFAQRALFSSSASVLSWSSSGMDEAGRATTANANATQGSASASAVQGSRVDAHPHAAEPGLKLWIQSPYDCVLAVKRDLSDNLEWLLEHGQYSQAWQLIDDHPEIVDSSTADRQSYAGSPRPTSPYRAGQGAQGSLAEFFADDGSQTAPSASHADNTAAQREKRRVGDLWLQQLVANEAWVEAGQVAGKVLGMSGRWEHWVLTFADADRFDEITSHIPSTRFPPPLPSVVYEVVLRHYVTADCLRLKDLMEAWDPELFDVRSVIEAVEIRLDSHEVDENTVEGGVRGRDWRILVETLARLYLAAGRSREALRCYIRSQNAEAAMSLIREEKQCLDAIADDVPGLLMLKVTPEQIQSASLAELEAASSEVVSLLVDEAHRGTVAPATVIRQLLGRQNDVLQPFLFFYLRALWRGPAKKEESVSRRKLDRRGEEGRALVEDHADLAVELFAEYDRGLLMDFLRASAMYRYEQAAAICERRDYVPELVYILSKTGDTKRALFLIIERLQNVSQAIAFAQENPDLWEDLLDYSMDKPRFIRGLLEEVGTSIDPIDLVHRIPEGLEIDGLRDGIARMIREYDIQHSISEGVARVLRGEVASAMDTLRAGQKRGVRFDVPGASTASSAPPDMENVPPGHCASCGDAFHENEKEPLIGFACGHVSHLSCLLRRADDPANAAAAAAAAADPARIRRVLGEIGIADDDDAADDDTAPRDEGGTRSVGAKVAHAHVIHRAVRGGCRRCGRSGGGA